MVGMIDHIRRGGIALTDRIVFHNGGNSARRASSADDTEKKYDLCDLRAYSFMVQMVASYVASGW